MYDFASSKLLPKVYTDTPSLDNYEVSNLISEDYFARARGFLAYSTIKPPVEITFELICPVNIHYVVLSTCIGTQKCTAIELFTKKHDEKFVSVGWARYDNNGVVFCNRRYYSFSNQPPNIDKSFALIFFKSNSYKSFTTANFVKVCIVQTTRSVPCLGKVEIWGKPSKLCSPTTLNSINRLVSNNSNSSSQNNIASPIKPILVPDNWEIPEEFKDALTFEVMSVPLTLPSGKTIDNTTLEKYLVNEASYGRPASDPFTGLPFTDSRRPLLNTALKSRIDMFLIQHSEKPETFTIKRTLGKRPAANEDTVIYNSKKTKDIQDTDDILTPFLKNPDELLNEAIKRTMNSSDFIQFTTVETVVPVVPSCSKCKIESNLYIVPCEHLYCRNCLLDLSKQSNQCTICAKVFMRSEVNKFHCESNKRR